MLKSVREELLPLFWELAHSSLFVAHTGQANVRAFFQLDAICRAQKFANIYDGISALVICSRIPFGKRMNAFQFNLLEYSEDVKIFLMRCRDARYITTEENFMLVFGFNTCIVNYNFATD